MVSAPGPAIPKTVTGYIKSDPLKSLMEMAGKDFILL